MIINLEHERDIYLGKDTIVAYAREEDKSCNYLELNEITKLPVLKKDYLTKRKNIQESDLVFSPAQVTEHRCVELKDQEISEQTRQRFEKLKGKYPKVFSTSSEDIGRTNLVTMHVDTGDNPQYVKSRTHYLLSITAGFNRKSKHWNAPESSGRASALGPVQLLWYPRNHHLVKPQGEECA